MSTNSPDNLEEENTKENQKLEAFNYRYIIQIFYNPISFRIFSIMFSAMLLAIALATGIGITAAIFGLCISFSISVYGIIAEMIKYKKLYQIRSADKKSSKFVALKNKEGETLTYVKEKDINNSHYAYDEGLSNYLLKIEGYKPIFSHFQNDLMKVLSEASKGSPKASRQLKNLLFVYGPEIFLPLATIPLTGNITGLLHSTSGISTILGSFGNTAWKLLSSNSKTSSELDTKNQNAQKLVSELEINSENIKDKKNHKNIAQEMQARYEIAKINEIITRLYKAAEAQGGKIPDIDSIQNMAKDEFKEFGSQKYKKNIPFYIAGYFKTHFSHKTKTKFNLLNKKGEAKSIIS